MFYVYFIYRQKPGPIETNQRIVNISGHSNGITKENGLRRNLRTLSDFILNVSVLNKKYLCKSELTNSLIN